MRATPADWRRRVEKDLGDVSFEEALSSTPAAGLVRQPLYTAVDLPAPKDPAGFPGLMPYTRGRQATAAPFRIAKEYNVEAADVEAADVEGAAALGAALRSDVEAGVGLVWLRCDGTLSPQAATLLVDGVDLDRLAIVLDAGDDAAVSAAHLVDAVERLETSGLHGGFGCDPLGSLAAQRGDGDFEGASEVLTRSHEQYTGMRALLVASTPYCADGASAVHELAFAIATGTHYLRRFTRTERTSADVAREILFVFHPASDLFLEIAKLRAARLLWAKVLRGASCDDASTAMVLHVRSAVHRRRAEDPWRNLLSDSAEGFAAALGGAESIVASPHDGEAENPSPDGPRLAVSALHVLREEAQLARVLDPAGGSYYVEKLTDDLARAAWKLFQEIERTGGMDHALANGQIAAILAEDKT